MQVATPPVLQLPPLTAKSIQLWIATLWPQPYSHTDAFAIGPLSEQSLVRSSQTSGDTCTASRHTHQWYVSGCVPDELGTAGQ